MAQDDSKPKPDKSEEEPSGFLVRRCLVGEGFIIGDDIEIRIGTMKNNSCNLAIKAPKTTKIRRLESK